MFRKISPSEQGLMTLLKLGRLCWCDPLGPRRLHMQTIAATFGTWDYIRIE